MIRGIPYLISCPISPITIRLTRFFMRNGLRQKWRAWSNCAARSRRFGRRGTLRASCMWRGQRAKARPLRMLEIGLGATGRSGAFMGPHLFDYRERFSVDGEFVSQRAIQELWQERIQPFCVQIALNHPQQIHTFHEVSILMALALFERFEVKWAAMETGVGGRYDQTHALDVVATVLTNVGSDHAHMLGPTLWQRVLDKAGIARPGVPFFTSERDPESLEIIDAICQDVGAPLTVVGEEAVRLFNEHLQAPERAHLPDQALLTAVHQQWNGALALAVINHLSPMLDEAVIFDRLSRAQLLGRFWRVEEGIYADIAHNVEKMKVLVDEVQTKFPDQGKIFVVGISGHRIADEVFASLVGVAKAVIVTAASYKGQDPSIVRASIEPWIGEIPTWAIADPRGVGSCQADARRARYDCADRLHLYDRADAQPRPLSAPSARHLWLAQP